ncbi:bifunctional diguanylate cyclase/phosphodiesterase [Luteimonas sp. SDU101]|uniref:bifunctional diguanylate cyclase/phosphodiesterase n=1 Tax=Luteimonas sp. SDU101 TaxID=3422593 RepID=UPI003EBB73C6
MSLPQRKRLPGSVRKVLAVGVVLGLLMMLGLALLLQQDRNTRVASAQRQALALSAGVDRLLQQEFGSLERAMAGIAADAHAYSISTPERADAMLQQAISGVVSRRAELASIVVVDGQGRASAGAGDDDAELPGWLARAKPGRLAVGTIEADGDGGWWLRVGMPFDEGRWLLARLRTVAIERMIGDLDIGREGNVTVLDRDGVVLARQPNGGDEEVVGRRTRLPPELANASGTATGLRVSQIDGVARLSGFSATSGYDLVVVAGLGFREALLPWYRSVSIACGFALLYWLGLTYFVYRLSGGERLREALLDELEEQADWLDQAQRASRTGVWRIEADGERVKVSAHTAAIFGFPAEAAVLPVAQFFERVHPEDRERVEKLFAQSVVAGGPSYATEYRVSPQPGVERWIRSSGGRVADSRGQARITGTVADVTADHEAQQRVERAEAQFRALFERNPLPFWVFDAQTLRFLAVNDAAIAAYGYSQDEFRSMTILDIRPASERREVEAAMQRRDYQQDVDGVWAHLRRDGSRLDARVFSSAIEFGGRPARLVLAEDVSDRMAYERDLTWRATHDDLTGLLRLPAMIEQIDTRHVPGTRYAAAFVRLRDLELVAPTLGATTSQLLLREVATRLTEVGREFGMVGFWPGESFVVVTQDPARQQQLLAALQEAIAMPVPTEAGAHPVEAWIGIAEGPDPGEGAGQVISHAALAALQAGREQVPVLPYDRSMADQAAERIEMARRLRNALANDEFELHYQPIMRLSDGQPVALEALLRWRQDGRLVSPAVFMPLAEASGLIVPIGRWVLGQAARCHRSLVGRGLGEVAIAVNISAVQLLGDNIADAVREEQRRHNLPSGALHVELTESVVLRQPQAARARMLELRDAGVPISIDDFGTGFSSMAYLRDLPLDYLKIDRSFVQDVHKDERNASICRALIALAQGLGLGTIAEGVEQEGERDWLRAHGCDQVQGFLLGRPAPLDVVLDAIRTRDLRE